MRIFRNIIIILVFLLIIAATILYFAYNHHISAVDKNSTANIEVIIDNGATTKQIGKILKEKGLIHNEEFFVLYLKYHKINDIKATRYELNKSMTLDEIIEVLRKGNNYNPDQISITFREGINMRKIAEVIAANTKNAYDEVFNVLKDEEYIDSLISKHWFITEEIKNKDIYYPLEGYLYPNTYSFKNDQVTVKEIFDVMLKQMDVELTKYKKEIDNSNFTVHEILTLSSVIQLEGGKKKDANGTVIKDDRAGIASVFINRLDSSMSLGSDVTTYYAVKVELSERELYKHEFNTYNPYNTRGPNMISKLPVGPIACVEKETIMAVINPLESDYYFFVADKYNNTFFTKTNAEHVAKINELKAKGDWYQYGN